MKSALPYGRPRPAGARQYDVATAGRRRDSVTKTGKRFGGLAWDKSSVHRQLTNQIYVGKVDFQGEVYTGEHEAIIDETTFARVQKLLARQGPGGGRRAAPTP